MRSLVIPCALAIKFFFATGPKHQDKITGLKVWVGRKNKNKTLQAPSWWVLVLCHSNGKLNNIWMTPSKETEVPCHSILPFYKKIQSLLLPSGEFLKIPLRNKSFSKVFLSHHVPNVRGNGEWKAMAVKSMLWGSSLSSLFKEFKQLTNQSY